MSAKYLNALIRGAAAKENDPARRLPPELDEYGPSEYQQAHEERVQLPRSMAGRTIPAAMAQKPDQQSASRDEVIERFVNEFIRDVAASKPAWKHGFKDEKARRAYRVQLTQSLYRNKINKPEYLAHAKQRAIDDETPFFPPVGKIIAWAKEKMPVSGELNAAMYREYRPERLLSSEPEHVRKEKGEAELQKTKELLAKSRAEGLL
ncbi:hypothetical protein D6833_01405 [Candidatus Parcubacteria bacterium]|nr:MAG: hypothetical protein D6833_01405 [Candidatus Parcubacteria bacterium]